MAQIPETDQQDLLVQLVRVAQAKGCRNTKAVVEKLGIPRSTFYAWKRGTLRMSSKQAAALRRQHGIGRRMPRVKAVPSHLGWVHATASVLQRELGSYVTVHGIVRQDGREDWAVQHQGSRLQVRVVPGQSVTLEVLLAQKVVMVVPASDTALQEILRAMKAQTRQKARKTRQKEDSLTGLRSRCISLHHD